MLNTDGSKLVRELDDLGEVVCIETRNVLGVVAFRDRLSSALYEQIVNKYVDDMRERKRTKEPVRRPRPRGEYATMAMPSSCAVLNRLSFSNSTSRQRGEYSTCRAAIG